MQLVLGQGREREAAAGQLMAEMCRQIENFQIKFREKTMALSIRID